MAYNQELTIPAHHNIYNGDNNRLLKLAYSIPQEGTNDETGLLLLVPGFGGDINSNVYKKMRESFADTYNLVTIQCDYFGSKFMQESDKVIYSQDSLKNVLSEDDTLLLEKDSDTLV